MAVKITDLTTATGQDTTWFVPITNPATGQTYKITVANLDSLMGGGGGDITPPTVVTATMTGATSIVVTFNESVTVTTAGWSFKKNGSNWAVSSVTGSGTTWTFTMSGSGVAGDVILRSYDSATGATTDTATNELASFTDAAVTNGLGEYIDWDQLTQTSDAGSGTIDGTSTTTPAGGTATKKLTKANGNFVQFTVGATVSDSEAVVLAIDNNNDAVYRWGTSAPPTDVVVLASAYHAAGDYYYNQDSNGTATNLGGTPTAGDVVRLEITNTNDVLVKVNGSTIGTITGALTGYTDLYVKAIFAVNSTAKSLESCLGLGLVTI